MSLRSELGALTINAEVARTPSLTATVDLDALDAKADGLARS
jgi:hypothetical protein